MWAKDYWAICAPWTRIFYPLKIHYLFRDKQNSLAHLAKLSISVLWNQYIPERHPFILCKQNFWPWPKKFLSSETTAFVYYTSKLFRIFSVFSLYFQKNNFQWLKKPKNYPLLWTLSLDQNKNSKKCCNSTVCAINIRAQEPKNSTTFSVQNRKIFGELLFQFQPF